MTSDLSIIARRIRDFIAKCATQFAAKDSGISNFQLQEDAEFNAHALTLFAAQHTYNLSYRKFCEARKISPTTVSHWTQIPPVPTTAFKELEITSLAVKERTHVFHSSGTTVQWPSRHFHSAESLSLYEASALAWFPFHFHAPRHLAILTPPPREVPHSSLVHMLECIRLEFSAPPESFLGCVAAEKAWNIDFARTVELLELASQKNENVLLLGTAFSFVHLLDFLADNDLSFKLPAGSRVMETGGYKNRSRALPKMELHELIESRLGISRAQIVCEYGMSELSSQAYDAEVPGSRFQVPSSSHFVNRSFVFPPWARGQVVSPENGRAVAGNETGLLRVFDLANVFSVMAIQTEDLAVRRGNGFELIGRADRAEPRGCSLMTVAS